MYVILTWTPFDPWTIRRNRPLKSRLFYLSSFSDLLYLDQFMLTLIINSVKIERKREGMRQAEEREAEKEKRILD